MQSDDVVWDIINNSFCSFKASVARERTFCQNPYNVTGLCLKSACPLANSRYATIREEEGVCYLYMKTVERAHMPKKLWEKIRLPGNYTKALEIVSEHLEYFPKYLVHRNKQRLTKIHQMIIRMRKMKLKGAGPKIVTTNTKVDRREKGRERKALKAAQLEKAIEEELLERLKQVNESEIYNYPEQQYNKALKMANDNYEEEEDAAVKERKKNKSATNGDDDDDDEEVESELEYEDEEEEDQEYNIEYVEDFDESDEEDGEENEIEHSADQLAALYNSMKRKLASKGKGGKGGKGELEIEYEEEDEGPVKQKASRRN